MLLFKYFETMKISPSQIKYLIKLKFELMNNFGRNYLGPAALCAGPQTTSINIIHLTCCGQSPFSCLRFLQIIFQSNNNILKASSLTCCLGQGVPQHATFHTHKRRLFSMSSTSEQTETQLYTCVPFMSGSDITVPRRIFRYIYISFILELDHSAN